MSGLVEVWVESTHRWVPGFELRERLEDGTLVVARPGEAPLPRPLPPDRVRVDLRSTRHLVGEAGGRHAGRPLGRRW